MIPNIFEEDEKRVVEAYMKYGHTITREQAEAIWMEYSEVEFYAVWMSMGDDLDVIYELTIKYAKELGVVTEGNT